MHGTRVNWVGMTGAVVLFGYGWWREPLAAVLGGMILLADLVHCCLRRKKFLAGMKSDMNSTDRK